jgi:hypothetical protein
LGSIETIVGDRLDALAAEKDLKAYANRATGTKTD